MNGEYKFTVNDMNEPGHTVQWCPGCGDFGILMAIKTAIVKLKIDPKNVVVVSGIGCSSKLPHYLKTYGIETIHGRALPVASGLRLANDDLHVIVVGGDGDGGLAHIRGELDGDLAKGEQAEEQHQDHPHSHSHRAANGKGDGATRTTHGASSSKGVGFTFWPGRMRSLPRTTTQSPASNPVRTSYPFPAAPPRVTLSRSGSRPSSPPLIR